jgi:thioredoxin reductase (NADPH)
MTPSHAPNTDTPVIETDVVVIGAGPVGLFQVFQLGLLDIRCHVVDALPHPGGQPVALYPGKPIFDIPGVPMCTGQQLTDNLLQQVAPFQPGWHLGQTVTRLERQSDGRFALETSAATRFSTGAVVIAAGVGAFQPRGLKATGVEDLSPAQLAYHPVNPERFAGQRVLVVGGDDEALRFALAVAADGPHTARHVTLLHRRNTHNADAHTLSLLQTRLTRPGLEAVTGQVASVTADGTGVNVSVTAPDGMQTSLVVDTVAVFLGLSPRLGPISDWGLDMTRKQLPVNTEDFSTHAAGVFAVGDINTYPGKKKLIVCGFHECVLAAHGVHAHLRPDTPALLQYTTTSPKLHRLLGLPDPLSP